MQVDSLQFLDADEKQQYDDDCSPFGCPHAGPVILTVGCLRRCQKDRAPHVCISLRVRKSVRVSGAIVGYGKAAIPVRRIDTCACVGCDEERRGIRVVHGRMRGDPFGPKGATTTSARDAVGDFTRSNPTSSSTGGSASLPHRSNLLWELRAALATDVL